MYVILKLFENLKLFDKFEFPTTKLIVLVVEVRKDTKNGSGMVIFAILNRFKIYEISKFFLLKGYNMYTKNLSNLKW